MNISRISFHSKRRLPEEEMCWREKYGRFRKSYPGGKGWWWWGDGGDPPSLTRRWPIFSYFSPHFPFLFILFLEEGWLGPLIPGKAETNWEIGGWGHRSIPAPTKWSEGGDTISCYGFEQNLNKVILVEVRLGRPLFLLTRTSFSSTRLTKLDRSEQK